MQGYGGYLDLANGLKWQMEVQQRLSDEKCLERYGYKVYSQYDEDGILQEIFRRIGTTDKSFVEFGVQDGLECNSHYLLLLGWSGLWIEGNKDYCEGIKRKFEQVINSGKLRIKESFITKENINALISSAGLEGEIDFLSIDIDGNDYYIWEEIKVINPRVVCIEYNAKFPPECDWIMPYREKHIWRGNDYFGASLKALERLGETKGYQLVGTNLSGINAFFVRGDLAKDLFFYPSTAENLYNPPRYQLTYENGHPCFQCVLGQPASMILKGDRTQAQEMYDQMENALLDGINIYIENFSQKGINNEVLEEFTKRFHPIIRDIVLDKKQDYVFLKSQGNSCLKNNSSYIDIQRDYDQKYYLTDCGGYEVYKKSKGKELDGRLAPILSVVRDKKKRILDIGCGRGELSFALARTGAKVVGIDYSESAICLAKETYREYNLENLEFRCMDAFQLLDSGEKFDIILMTDVVEHIEQPYLEKLFEGCKKLLTEAGVLLIHTAPNLDYYNITYPILRNNKRDMGGFLPENPRSYYEKLMHINEQTPQNLKSTLEKYFSPVHVWTGEMKEIKNLKTQEERNQDNQIFALAACSKQAEEKFISDYIRRPAPDDFAAKLLIIEKTLKGQRGGRISGKIRLENHGRASLDSWGYYPVFVSYHLYKKEDELLVFDGERTKIPYSLFSGESLEMEFNVQIPSEIEKGEYKIIVTLVAEGCFWFDDKDICFDRGKLYIWFKE